MAATLLFVPVADVPDAWKYCAPFIQDALETTQGENDIVDVEQFCREGAWQLWALAGEQTVVGAAVTQVVKYPRKTMLELIYFGATLPREEWLAAMSNEGTLETWAKKRGCTHIMLHGRNGAERACKQHGYERWYVCMGKNLAA